MVRVELIIKKQQTVMQPYISGFQTFRCDIVVIYYCNTPNGNELCKQLIRYNKEKIVLNKAANSFQVRVYKQKHKICNLCIG